MGTSLGRALTVRFIWSTPFDRLTFWALEMFFVKKYENIEKSPCQKKKKVVCYRCNISARAEERVKKHEKKNQYQSIRYASAQVLQTSLALELFLA